MTVITSQASKVMCSNVDNDRVLKMLGVFPNSGLVLQKSDSFREDDVGLLCQAPDC